MDDPRCWTDLAEENARLLEVDRLAQLVVTAFRLRDEDALIAALRALEREVCRQEERAMQVEEAAIGETHKQAPFDHEGAPR